MPMTQRDRVNNTLHRAPDGVCSRFFIFEIHPGIPRIAARIADLRAEGLDIRSEECDLHPGRDHLAYHIKYRIATGGLF